MTMKLYTYWRSQAAFRVRIALRMKGLEAELIPLDILKGDQFAPNYRALNPEAVVPTLVDGDGPPLTQSLAILEYLEERYPKPPLLPADARMRAHVRALAHIVAADTHPFVVPRVRNYLDKELHADGPTIVKWMQHWFDTGSRTLEEILARDGRTGKCCVGDTPGLADLCLVAHVTSSKMVPGANVSGYPTVNRIFEHCMQIEAFASAQPSRQPDAPSPARG